MSWISGEFVIDSISQQSLAKARAQIVDRVRHNADLEEFSNMGEDIGNITPIYPPESCCRSLQSAEEWYENSYAAFHRPYQKYIPFLDTDSLPNNKRLLTLEKRLQDEISKRNAYYNAHNVQNLQAKYIGCKHCGSKVNKDYIHNNSCPVCHNNMLSDTVQKRLDALNARIDGLKTSIVAEKERRAAKAPTRYLVVYCEYVG